MECHNNKGIKIDFREAFGDDCTAEDIFCDLFKETKQKKLEKIIPQTLEPERDCSALIAETMKNRKTNFQHLVKQAEEEELYGINDFYNNWAKEAYVLYSEQEARIYEDLQPDPNLQKGIDDIARNLLECDDNTKDLSIPCKSIIENGIIGKLYNRRYEVLLEDKVKEYGMTK